MSIPNQPLVSVIITCYNQAHFIGEAIESVRAQTYKNLEILVVDDESADNPEQVVACYPEVRYFRQKNQGVSAARNAGVRETEGKYVVFLDADDQLLPQAIEMNLDHLEAHPEYGFVCGHRTHIAHDGTPSPTNLRPCIDGDYDLELLRRNYIGPPSAVLHRREVLESVGGFNSLVDSSDDYDLYLRIVRRFPIRCHHGVIVEYRLHGTNTSQNNALMLRSTLNTLRRHKDRAKEGRQYREAYEEGIRHGREVFGEPLINEIRTHARARGERRQALRGAATLLRYYPQAFVKHAFRKFYCVVFKVNGI